ncbi:MAG: hypothetical protein M1836_007054 [Candelina mexicana]|nr:MAG: hypothetical protein M1836_007054 [Candelina mexicana]
MQFNILAIAISALAATATAAGTNSTTPRASGTGAAAPSGTFSPGNPTQSPFISGGALNGVSGSALALVIAGGVALTTFVSP